MEKRETTTEAQGTSADFSSLQHEAGDRTHVIASTFSAFVQSHRFIYEQPELAAQADAISEALGRLYQSIWQASNDAIAPQE